MTGRRASMRLSNISISLGLRKLIEIDDEVAPGEVLTVMGPSGSGKSTLLNFIAGFLDPVFSASGRVLLDDEDVTEIPPHRRRVGLLFQDPLLFPHMSVGANLLFAVAPGDRESRRARVTAALEEAGLAGYRDADPSTLSGGQKARIALMRVLLSEPRGLLLDEPFSRLDADRRSRIRSFVFDEAKQRNLPVLLVTHDAEDAIAAGGRIFKLATQ